MFYSIREFEKAFQNLKINKKEKQYIIEEVKKYLELYKGLNRFPISTSLLIVDAEEKGLMSIRVFEKKNVPVEILDNSFTNLEWLLPRNKDKIKALFWINFTDNYNLFEVLSCTVKDIQSLQNKKAKTILYGLSDTQDVLTVSINQLDVKGAEYEVLKNAVKYYFEKHFERSVQDLDCYVIEFNC